MISIFVDGTQEKLNTDRMGKFESLIEALRESYNSEEKVISQLIVDGQELTDRMEQRFRGRAVDEFKKVEVRTLPKSVMAAQMLEGVQNLLVEMMTLSHKVAEQKDVVEIYRQFTRLIDGLQVFIDTIQTVRLACKIINTQSLAILEADLLSVMKDLMMYCSENKIDYLQSILRNDLPVVLAEWSDEGIPELEVIIKNRK